MAGVRASAREVMSARRRPSSFLVWFALLTSAAVVLSGSAMIFGLFSQREGGGPSAIANQTGYESPLVVAVARTPGGPSEWRSYIRALSGAQDHLGRTIHVRYVADGDEAPALLRSGAVQAAFMSVSRYLKLEESEEVTLVAAPIVDGRKKDAAVLVVDSQSRYRTIEDLRGAQALVSSPSSLAGNVYLYWYMDKRGTAADEFFSSVTTSTSQNENLRSVLAGTAEVTSVNRSALASWPQSAFRVVAQSPEFGMPPVVALASLDAVTVEGLRAALVRFREPARAVPQSVLGGFSAPQPTAYDFARELARYSAKSRPSASAGEDKQ